MKILKTTLPLALLGLSACNDLNLVNERYVPPARAEPITAEEKADPNFDTTPYCPWHLGATNAADKEELCYHNGKPVNKAQYEAKNVELEKAIWWRRNCPDQHFTIKSQLDRRCFDEAYAQGRMLERIPEDPVKYTDYQQRLFNIVEGIVLLECGEQRGDNLEDCKYSLSGQLFTYNYNDTEYKLKYLYSIAKREGSVFAGQRRSNSQFGAEAYVEREGVEIVVNGGFVVQSFLRRSTSLGEGDATSRVMDVYVDNALVTRGSNWVGVRGRQGSGAMFNMPEQYRQPAAQSAYVLRVFEGYLDQDVRNRSRALPRS